MKQDDFGWEKKTSQIETVVSILLLYGFLPLAGCRCHAYGHLSTFDGLFLAVAKFNALA